GQRLFAAPPRLFIDDARRFAHRFARFNIRLRGRTHVELETPATLGSDLRAPQLDGADFREPRMQAHRDSSRLAAALGSQHSANWRQGSKLFRLDLDQLAGPVGEPRARDVQRKLDGGRYL